MTTLTDDGRGYDVAIGGLPFLVDARSDRPYERATASFRKEQFDSAPVVGDQSLTGWWTRGQLSFHKGAGLTYYEVLEGETVLERYSNSTGVDVHGPGAASLLPALSETAVAALDCVAAPSYRGGGVYALTDTGVTYVAANGTTNIATSDAVVPTSITSNGDVYFVANGTKIERQLGTADLRTNYVTNPNFEYASDADIDWTPTNGFTSRSLTHTRYGAASMKCQPTAGNYGGASTTVSGVTVGDTYVLRAWVYCVYTAEVRLKADTTVVDSQVQGSTAGGWLLLESTYVPAATSFTLTVEAFAGPTSQDLYVDAVLVTESPFVDDYFDGSTPGGTWLGTPHHSQSTNGALSAGASQVIWTHSGGKVFERVWWAKGRIFALDNDGYWYALSAVGGTVAQTDAFWNSADADLGWCVSDGPGPAYISDGHSIYSVSVDTAGVVPTLGVPTTAAQVPAGETIAAIQHYLGYLVVVTSLGVRIALVKDGGELVLGPLVIRGDFSACVRVGCYDTRAFVTGRPEGRLGATEVCSIDLSQSVDGGLTFAWAPHATLTDETPSACGGVPDSNGLLYAWGAGSVQSEDGNDLVAEGYLITGYHRFGTLEPKFFSEVTVRIGGTGGSVEVFRVDADGTETSLGSLTTSSTVSLGLASVQERVALKFVLTRDATDSTKGPELLGYQLRALPAPQRQRMIRVPLLLNDREKRGSTRPRGYEGSAWDRLSALEAMEESGAVHDYQDFRTGESCQVFLESVEHRGITSPNGDSTGFGGTVFLTMRKV